MENEPLKTILKSKVMSAANIADRLIYSLSKTKSIELEYIDFDRLKSLSDEEMESLDACIYRFGSLVSALQDSIFKTIAEMELEDPASMSNRDKTNLMERIGALHSSNSFSNMAIFRNKLMHDYPEEAKKQIERLSLLPRMSSEIVDVFLGVSKYIQKFGVSIEIEDLPHLNNFEPNGKSVCMKCFKEVCVCSKQTLSNPKI